MPTYKKKTTKKTAKGKVLYSEVEGKIASEATDNPVTVEQAKDLLGWQEVDDSTPFLLKDCNGVKVRCNNNLRNRPLYPSNVKALSQEILRRRWRLNGEPLIVGDRGTILNGQHRLVALVLADQEITNNPAKWPDWVGSSPTIDQVLVYGVSEDDEVVNTIDTGKPRTLGDVIYRSDYFEKVPAADKKSLSRLLGYAVKMLWDRTGGTDAHIANRSHSESVDFLNRHPRLVEAVRHIWEEDSDKAVRKYLSPGYSSALLYLMGCSATDPEEYHSSSNPHEDLLDWSSWDKAKDYWSLIASGVKETKAIRDALGNLIADDLGGWRDRTALLIKGWLCYQSDQSITPGRVKLTYETDSEGWQILAETPTVGGIDTGGERVEKADEDEPEQEQSFEDRMKADLAKQSQKDAKDLARTAGANSQGGSKRGRRKGQTVQETMFEKGSHVWVNDPHGDHWDGTLEDYYDSDDGRVAQVKVVNGHVFDTPAATLQEEEPA